MITLLVLDLVTSGLHYVLILPWSREGPDDVREMRGRSALPITTAADYDLDDCSYQVISNGPFAEQESLDDVLGSIAAANSGKAEARRAMLRGKLQEKKQHQSAWQRECSEHVADESDANMLRPAVAQPLPLHDKDVKSQREVENKHAVGGMKNPRISLHGVPGHRKIGGYVSIILGRILDEDPTIHESIMKSIGDTTKTHHGPTTEQVLKARRKVEDYFCIYPDNSNTPPPLTELSAAIYRAWVQRAEDPDIFVPQWLEGGTPMGIEALPELTRTSGL